MANALRQPVLSIASRLMQITPKTLTTPVTKTFSYPQIATRGLTLSRNFWCASRKNSILSSNTKVHQHGKFCGCCSLHTQGDEKLTEFLAKEIEDEQKSVLTANSVAGWDMKADGTGVILSKQFNEERITVEFDVNDSIDSDESMAESGDEQEELVSKPPFEVTVEKKSGRKMRFFCEFTVGEHFEDEGSKDSIADQFTIVEVRLGDDKKSEDMEKFYSQSGAVMDVTLYDLLMDMLDERGIDDDFVNNMVDFATAYEHKLYVDFLQSLKSILSEK